MNQIIRFFCGIIIQLRVIIQGFPPISGAISNCFKTTKTLEVFLMEGADVLQKTPVGGGGRCLDSLMRQNSRSGHGLD